MKAGRWALLGGLLFLLGSTPKTQEGVCLQGVIHAIPGAPAIGVALIHGEFSKKFDETIEYGQILTWRVPCGTEATTVMLFMVENPLDYKVRDMAIPPAGMTNVWCVGTDCAKISEELGIGGEAGITVAPGPTRRHHTG